MSEQELATIQGPSQKIREVVENTALAGRGDPFHSDVYVNVQDGWLNLIVGSPGNVVLSYCTFTEAYLDDISVDDPEQGAEAIFDVGDFLSYLDFASDGGDVELALRGESDERLATVLEVTGALNTRVMLPASESILEEVPLGLPDRFNDDEEFTSAENPDKTLPTSIITDVEQIRNIIEIVDYDPETEFYPITVNDGEFTLDIGTDAERNAVWGNLEADSVDTPDDVSNYYHEGFESLFSTLQGEVRLQTAPGGAPLATVQDNYDGMVLRHVLGNVSE